MSSQELITACRTKLYGGSSSEEIAQAWKAARRSLPPVRGIQNRLNLEKVGLVDLGVEIIRADVCPEASFSAWGMLQDLVLSDDVDDPEEKKAGKIFADKGCFELAAKELLRTDRNWSDQILLDLAC